MDTHIQELLERAQAGNASPKDMQELMESARLELEKIKTEHPEEYVKLQRLMYEMLLDFKKSSEKK